MSRLGRNAPCPCGSGVKVKRCHAALVGADIGRVAELVLQGRQLRAVQLEIAGHRGYRAAGPTADELAAGWSIENVRAHGCPYLAEDGTPMCKDLDRRQLGGCAAGCGC